MNKRQETILVLSTINEFMEKGDLHLLKPVSDILKETEQYEFLKLKIDNKKEFQTKLFDETLNVCNGKNYEKGIIDMVSPLYSPGSLFQLYRSSIEENIFNNGEDEIEKAMVGYIEEQSFFNKNKSSIINDDLDLLYQAVLNKNFNMSREDKLNHFCGHIFHRYFKVKDEHPDFELWIKESYPPSLVERYNMPLAERLKIGIAIEEFKEKLDLHVLKDASNELDASKDFNSLKKFIDSDEKFQSTLFEESLFTCLSDNFEKGIIDMVDPLYDTIYLSRLVRACTIANNDGQTVHGFDEITRACINEAEHLGATYEDKNDRQFLKAFDGFTEAVFDGDIGMKEEDKMKYLDKLIEKRYSGEKDKFATYDEWLKDTYPPSFVKRIQANEKKMEESIQKA